MKRRTLPALLLPHAPSLAACGGGASSTGPGGGSADGKGSVTSNVGDQKGDYGVILRASGELDDLDHRITRSTFTSGPPLLEAVSAGAVDIGGVGNTPPVFAAGSDSNIVVVGAGHGSSAGEAIVAPKDSPLRKPEQLKGKSVAVAQGSSAHCRLVASPEKAGLSIKDVQLYYLQPADALAAFSRGKADAWAIWDPYTSQILRAGTARVLTTGEGVVDGLGFQVASPASLKDKQKAKALGDLLVRLERAQNWFFEHREEWAKVWARLPTGGDGRTLVDRHAYTDGGSKRDRITPVSGVRAPDIEYLAQIAKAAEQLGLRGGVDADRHVVRGRLTDHGGARAAHRAAEVPGRLPPWGHLAGARRPTADRPLGDLDAVTIAAAQQALGKSESVGQQRMLALHGGSRDKLEIAPNLWAGVGLVCGGAGTALVGSHAEVADRIGEYHALGVEHFVLSGCPHLEEAYWFGEGVTPELARRGLLSTVPASPRLGTPGAETRGAAPVLGAAPLLVAGGR